MVYEAETWCRLIASGDAQETEREMGYTLQELKVMDMARERMGIRFPADEER